MLHNSPNNSRSPATLTGTEAGPGIPEEAAENEHVVLSFVDLLSFIRRQLWLIASVVVLLTGASVGYSLLQTPMYEASIMILVGQERLTANEDRAVDAASLQKFTRAATLSTRGRSSGISAGFRKRPSRAALRKRCSWYLENQRWCERVVSGAYAGERLGLGEST